MKEWYYITTLLLFCQTSQNLHSVLYSTGHQIVEKPFRQQADLRPFPSPKEANEDIILTRPCANL